MNRTKKMQVNSGELIGRALLAAKLGYEYGGDRDIYQALGYPTSLKYEDFVARYDRQDVAQAVIDRPVDATWRGPIRITESTVENETPLEKAWKDLSLKLKLQSNFKRLDKLASIGYYGVLFLGFDDISLNGEFDTPVDNPKNLLYVKPFGEGHAPIVEWETDPRNYRFGLPKVYNLIVVGQDGNSQQTIRVHHSRVLHVAGKILESDCYGAPVLKVIWNRLVDLEKVVGSSAEMFWRGGRPGYHGKVEADHVLSDTAETDLKEKLDEYDHNLRRFLLTEGMDIKALESQVADPTNAFDIQIQAICSVVGIPKRILIGSERGELASSEDRNSWLDTVFSRREEYAEGQIVRPFVDLLIEYGVLPSPTPKGYKVEWEDLYAATEKEKAEIGRIRAEAVRAYASSPTAEDVFPLDAFYRYVMQLKDEQIAKIFEERDELLAEENRIITKLQHEQKAQLAKESLASREETKKALTKKEG